MGAPILGLPKSDILVFTLDLAVKSFYFTLISAGKKRLCNCYELVLLTMLKGLHVLNCNLFINTRITFAFQQNVKTIPTKM